MPFNVVQAVILFMTGKELLTSFNLKETDMYFLIGKALKVAFGLPQNTLFFEVPVGGSRADIMYVQTPNAFDGPLQAGLHVFEVKMRWDADRQRLRKQLNDYMRAVDYVWVVSVNGIPESRCENAGELVFSTNGCWIEMIRPARHNRETIDLGLRQELLEGVASELRNKQRLVEEMAWVNPAGENRVLVQEKLFA
jgi:hypothetical protein